VEAGVPNFSIYGWQAFFAPAKTPSAIVERLERDISAVLKRPEIQAQFDKIGLETAGGPSRKEIPAFVKDQIVSWNRAARDAGIQKQ
jgi:tripartite-type tricarboxylate transporter receptor subunit TctC